MKRITLTLSLVALAALVFAQLPNVNTDALKDQASSVGVANFKEIAKDIPFEFRSSQLSLNDPKYKVAGYDIDSFMKKVFIPALAKVVNALPAGKVVLIKGHANAVGPEEGTKTYGGNILLSQERADAVLRYLMKHSNLNKSKFKVVGVGSAEPVKGLDPTDKKNCRVSFDIQ